jgi:hypothetical protein
MDFFQFRITMLDTAEKYIRSQLECGVGTDDEIKEDTCLYSGKYITEQDACKLINDNTNVLSFVKQFLIELDYRISESNWKLICIYFSLCVETIYDTIKIEYDVHV